MAIPRDRDTMFDQHEDFSRDFPAATATITLQMMTMKRAFRVEFVELIVDADYASDTTDYYVLTLEHGSGPTASASWSTRTADQGSLLHAAPNAMVLSTTDANLVIPVGDVVSLLATKHGSGANITVRAVVHGRYL